MSLPRVMRTTVICLAVLVAASCARNEERVLFDGVHYKAKSKAAGAAEAAAGGALAPRAPALPIGRSCRLGADSPVVVPDEDGGQGVALPPAGPDGPRWPAPAGPPTGPPRLALLVLLK